MTDQSVQTSPTRSPRKDAFFGRQTSPLNEKTPRSKSANIPMSSTPDLHFLAMSHQIPSLFPSVPPFPVHFLNGGNETNKSKSELLAQLLAPTTQLLDERIDEIIGGTLETCEQQLPKLLGFGSHPKANSENCLPQAYLNSPDFGFCSALPTPPQQKSDEMMLPGTSTSKRGVTRDRDSGLGSSGPSHIQDWDSLAALLPRDVVQACSFFKNNAQVLQARSIGAANIDKLSRRRWRPQSEPAAARRMHRISKNAIPQIPEDDDTYDMSASTPAQCYTNENRHCQHASMCCHGCACHHHHCCCHTKSADNHNLRRWDRRCPQKCHSEQQMIEADEESEWSCEEMTPTPGPSRVMNEKKELMKPQSLALRHLSMSSDDDGPTANTSGTYTMPDAMYSEYTLRERDPRAQIRQYLSMYNMGTRESEHGKNLREYNNCNN
jgi:hypothetical protein